mgnify:FL=1
MKELYIDINAVHCEFPPYYGRSRITAAYQKGWNNDVTSIKEHAVTADVEPRKHQCMGGGE